jgi:hypothetical protein
MLSFARGCNSRRFGQPAMCEISGRHGCWLPRDIAPLYRQHKAASLSRRTTIARRPRSRSAEPLAVAPRLLVNVGPGLRRLAPLARWMTAWMRLLSVAMAIGRSGRPSGVRLCRRFLQSHTFRSAILDELDAGFLKRPLVCKVVCRRRRAAALGSVLALEAQGASQPRTRQRTDPVS